jgi:hypothetical protein
MKPGPPATTSWSIQPTGRSGMSASDQRRGCGAEAAGACAWAGGLVASAVGLAGSAGGLLAGGGDAWAVGGGDSWAVAIEIASSVPVRAVVMARRTRTWRAEAGVMSMVDRG